MERGPIIIGNWKMHGLAEDLGQISRLNDLLEETGGASLGLCVPATLIARAAETALGVRIGAQDCHEAESGAFTGCLSAAMLADAGASFVLVGHSECRSVQLLSDEDIRARAQAAVTSGLHVVGCVGERQPRGSRQEALDEVLTQMTAFEDLPVGRLTIAYEPAWAIGGDHLPDAETLNFMQANLRSVLHSRRADPQLNETPLLYGGAISTANAREVVDLGFDGVLVGRSSLTFDALAALMRSLSTAMRR